MSSETKHASSATLAAHGVSSAQPIALPFHFEAPVALNSTFCFPNVRIGRHSYINSGLIKGDVTIGRYCSIGRNVSIAAGDHPLDALTTHSIAYQCVGKPRRPDTSDRAVKHKTTEIGHDVWIGDNAVIINGVHVGTGAVIGANAVVTKDVPPYAIVGGVPARVIRMRFPEHIADRLLKSEWWMLKKETIQKLHINDVEYCLAQITLLRESDGIDDFDFQTISKGDA